MKKCLVATLLTIVLTIGMSVTSVVAGPNLPPLNPTSLPICPPVVVALGERHPPQSTSLPVCPPVMVALTGPIHPPLNQ